MPTKEAKKVRKFRLIKQSGPNLSQMGDAGPHYEPNPDYDPESPDSEDNIRQIEYLPGEVVKSTRELDKIFVNKFIPLGDSGDRSYHQSPGGDALPYDEDPDAERPVTSTEDALVRRSERHLTPDELEGKDEHLKLAKGKKLKKKETADEDEEEAEASETSSMDRAATLKTAAKSAAKATPEDEEDEDESESKEEVTDDFDGASDAGMQVFKEEDKYYVHEEDEDEPMRGSKKGFTTKAKVKKFIRENTKDEEEDEEE